jgi:hypothetical protein
MVDVEGIEPGRQEAEGGETEDQRLSGGAMSFPVQGPVFADGVKPHAIELDATWPLPPLHGVDVNLATLLDKPFADLVESCLLAAFVKRVDGV